MVDRDKTMTIHVSNVHVKKRWQGEEGFQEVDGKKVDFKSSGRSEG